MDLAPIILFVYNRPEHTKQALNALTKNELASDSALYIFADGPKINVTEDTLEQIKNTRSIIKEKKWCGEVHIIESEINKGLAVSIVEGVTEIVNKFGKVIVLEDDIVTSSGFLKFMNDALNIYQFKNSVMHISGYMYPNDEDLPETFFYNVPLCWGWATWNRAWKTFITDSSYLLDHFKNDWDSFNKLGGTELQDQLIKNVVGTFKTWFVKWHASVLICDGFCLFPSRSLVKNIGFDNSGEHCNKTEKFDTQIVDTIIVKEVALKENSVAEQIIKQVYKKALTSNKKHHSIQSILKRALLYLFPLLKRIKTLEAIQKKLSSQNESLYKSYLGLQVKITPPFSVDNSLIGSYTYISFNSHVSQARIGKYCSIGPNFFCGYGIHPIEGISTHPMFYSTLKQNGISLSEMNKIEERKEIIIGNDVFIGANVTILDGIRIGSGAVIAAGAVVVKDVPPYAIVGGVPAALIKYRFDVTTIENLLKLEWWDWPLWKLKNLEENFFNVPEFIASHIKSKP